MSKFVSKQKLLNTGTMLHRSAAGKNSNNVSAVRLATANHWSEVMLWLRVILPWAYLLRTGLGQTQWEKAGKQKNTNSPFRNWPLTWQMMVYKQEVTGCHRDLFFLFALVKCLSKSQLFFIVTGHALKESAVPLGLIVGFGGKSPIHLYRQELLREPTVQSEWTSQESFSMIMRTWTPAAWESMDQ